MDSSKYYKCVYDEIKRCFSYNDYVIAAGKELIGEEGCNDPGFPSLVVMPNDMFKYLTGERVAGSSADNW